MYNLPYFREPDAGAVLQFMKEHPFALMTGHAGGKLAATQLPFVVEEREGKLYLAAHMMRHTDHCHVFEENKQVLCVFTGPHCYVSARWYTEPRTASTWNYMTVHVHGILRFMDDDALRLLLEKQTSYFENDPHSPASFHCLPEEYVTRLMKAIVGFEVEVTGIEHVFKLSQNRDQQSFERIISELEKGSADERAIALEMQKRKKQLYAS